MFLYKTFNNIIISKKIVFLLFSQACYDTILLSRNEFEPVQEFLRVSNTPGNLLEIEKSPGNLLEFAQVSWKCVPVTLFFAAAQ